MIWFDIVSNDGGETFSEPQRISEDHWVINGCPHTGPTKAENDEGLHFAWFTGGKDKGRYYTKTAGNEKSFVTCESVSAMGSHPQIASLKNDQLLIVWDETQVNGNNVSKRLGIQRRNSEGKDYLTLKAPLQAIQ